MLLSFVSVFSFLAAAAAAARNSQSSPEDIAIAAGNARGVKPASLVKGKAFDRFVTIWLENTDYDLAAGDRMFFRSK